LKLKNIQNDILEKKIKDQNVKKKLSQYLKRKMKDHYVEKLKLKTYEERWDF